MFSVQLITNYLATYPSATNEFLEFENLDVYGFTMQTFPIIKGLIAFDLSARLFRYIELDATGNVHKNIDIFSADAISESDKVTIAIVLNQ